MKIDLEIVKIKNPQELNVIIGQSHFIKTAEDIYEALVTAVPTIKFALAFSEASGKCLLRLESNDEDLRVLACENALSIGCGHSFIIFLKNAFPINVLNQIKKIPEVCHIFCATANPLEIIVAQTEQGRGILGVIDGLSPKGVETELDVKSRKELLRKFGYKL
ncbi:MAG: adenosine monophosphate-protein transferase [Candidatus Omnitrophica bacterium]|nr:adenosine monophosphate-protein transferase [Candidatus Omnitrophota bacterium]